MGYRRKRKTITLTFGEKDGDLDGLEVVTRSLPLGTYLNLMGAGEEDNSGLADVLDEFTRCLVSWNLEDEDGTPVPATEEAVRGEDHDDMIKVATRWLDAMGGVAESDPLPQSSPGGEPSLAASIPMDVPSESLAS